MSNCKDNIDTDAFISIIIPAFNMSQYLTRCLDSILIDRLKDIEIIVVNDGSTDSTEKLLYQYSSLDRRVKIINQENSGRGIARNTGMSAAKGKYIYLVDCDDYINKNSLYYLYRTSIKKGLDICFIYPPRIRKRPMKYISCAPGWSYMFKRSLLYTPCEINQPDIFSGADGIFSNLLFSRSRRAGISFRAGYNYCKRPDSTSDYINNNVHLLTDLIHQHILILRNEYNKNSLWKTDAARYFLFLQDETFSFRLINRLRFLSYDQFCGIYMLIKYELIYIYDHITRFENIFFKKAFLDILNLTPSKYINKYNLKISN